MMPSRAGTAHLHQFDLAGGVRLGRPDWDDENEDVLDGRRTTLARLKKDEQFVYEFDFGDSWEHLCTVGPLESTPSSSSAHSLTRLCLTGAGYQQRPPRRTQPARAADHQPGLRLRLRRRRPRPDHGHPRTHQPRPPTRTRTTSLKSTHIHVGRPRFGTCAFRPGRRRPRHRSRTHPLRR
jgi:hypothetical protein